MDDEKKQEEKVEEEPSTQEEPTTQEVVEDVDADTRDESEKSDEIYRKLDELYRRVDSIAAMVAKSTVNHGDAEPVYDEVSFVPIDQLDLD